MAIANFIPELWSDSINVALRKSQVLGALCTQSWSGELKSIGDTVNILGVTTGAVSAYDPTDTMSYGDLSDTSTKLVVDQADKFAFGVDDVDKMQSIGGLVEQATSDYAYKLVDAMEQYIFGLVDSAAEVGSLIDYTDSGDAILTKANVLEAIGKVAVALDEANVPNEGRWGVVSSAVYNLIVQAEIGTLLSESAWKTGEAVSVMGITIFKSNNVPSTSSTLEIKNLFGQGPAIALANTITEVEALRLESAFRDGIRGLNVYGAKVVNKERLVILDTDLVVTATVEP